jgi:hypothetical protein
MSINQDELLRRIKAMRDREARHGADTYAVQQAVEQTPTGAMPPSMSVPRLREPAVADPRLAQASQLEQQAAPTPGPQGAKEHLINGIRAGLEGFAGGYTGRGGYNEQEAMRQGLERQRQQDLLNRAKSLRGEAMDQQQLNMQQQQNSLMEQNRQADNERGNRQLEIAEAQSKRGKFSSGANGMIYNADTGEMVQGPQPSAASQRNIDPLSPEGIKASAERAKAMQDAAPPKSANEPGAYMDLRNDNGQVIGAWNPKSGEFHQIPAAAEGSRRTGLPAGERQQLAATEVMLQDIGTLRSLANAHRGSIGPVEGRVAAVKRLTIGEDPEVNELFRISDNLSDQLLRARSGAQINEEEDARLRTLVPNPRMPEV